MSARNFWPRRLAADGRGGRAYEVARQALELDADYGDSLYRRLLGQPCAGNGLGKPGCDGTFRPLT